MNHSCLFPASGTGYRVRWPGLVFLLLAVLFAAYSLTSPHLAAEEFRFAAADGPEKINAALNHAKPGDRILLRRGDTFAGPLVGMIKGSKDQPVTLGAWGEGADPVLVDLVPIASWESAGRNLWKSILPRPKGQRKHVPAMLLRQSSSGGPPAALALGREPDLADPWDGYRVIGKGASQQSITPPGLDRTVDWTGAEVVMRTRRWILDRLTVRTVVDGKMIFREKLSADYFPYDSFGFFIQNHPACLDQEGEWCFNPERREILLFSSTRPEGGECRYTTLQTLLDLRESAWLLVENIDLRGSNETCVRVDDSVSLTLRNCRISQTGRNALAGYDTTGFLLQSCTFDRVQNNAVDLGKAIDLVIRGNTMSNTALVPGMGQGGDGQYNALQTNGTGILVEDNLITNTGYLPISFGGDKVMVRHNVIDGYALAKDDCGGIYTWSDGKTVHKDRQVVENLIKNGKGVMGGQTWDGTSTQGIYMDDRTDHVVIRGNIIQDISESGIFVHNSHDLEILDNTVYGCALQLMVIHDSIAPDHPVRNVKVAGNVFAAARPGQILGRILNTDDPAVPVLDFRGNSWLSPFLRQGVLSIGAKDRAAASLFLEDLTKPGGPDPSGRIPARFISGITSSGEPGPELLTDGAFAFGTSRWGWWSNRDAGRVLQSGPGTVRLDFPKPSTNSDSMLLFNSAAFNLEAKRYYRLGFRARSSVPGVVLSFLTRKAGEPWTQSSPEQAWRLDTEFKDLSALLPAWTSEPESRAEFILRQTDLADALAGARPADSPATLSAAVAGTSPSLGPALPEGGALPWVEIQAVEFRPVEARLTDPLPFIRLLANPGPVGVTAGTGQGQPGKVGTELVKSAVPAPMGTELPVFAWPDRLVEDAWADAWGKPVRTRSDPKPWSALVLVRE